MPAKTFLMSEIVVCVDIRDLRIAKTGTKTHLEELRREFKKGHPGFVFHFIDTWIPVYTGGNKLLKAIEHIRFLWWKQFSLPIICLFKKCDLLFCSDYFLPFFTPGFKTSVIFHDAFFWQQPEQYNPFWLFLLKTIGVAAAKKADAVITTTQYAKTQIVKFVGLQPEKIYAIPVSCKASIWQKTNLQDRNEYNGKKYILHIGVMEKRKNLPNLIKAFHLLLQGGFENYFLVLAGPASPKAMIDDSLNIHKLITTLGLQEKVILAGYIADEELAYYYKNATVYAFVSINEGFGVPVLESFHNNLPVLVADNSSLPEVGGDAVITCDPFDVNDIKEKLKMIIEDVSLQQDLVARGRERVKLFSWQRTVRELLIVFSHIHSKKNNW